MTKVVDVSSSETWKPHVQVGPGYYCGNYDSYEAWIRYYWAINNVLSRRLTSVLEIGVGSGVVSSYLRRQGVRLTTFDIDSSLQPDVMGSVTNMPFSAGEFDAVICCEVLEHMPWENSLEGLQEIHRVSKGFAFISVPNFVLSFAMLVRAPILQLRELRIRVPYPKAPPRGEHYWEIGRRGYPKRKLDRAIHDTGFRIVSDTSPRTNYSACFYALEKTNDKTTVRE
jgi:SAM-dependent methyltransferase